MKKIRIGMLMLICGLLLATSESKAAAPAPPPFAVSFGVFYDNLSPYGDWIQDPNYGYVWVPNVAPGFQPYYTNGYWAMTDYGNTWVSDYAWGWAPFHYGRWTYDAYYGWVWIPNNVWGPAWVCWRSSNDYYGWAPLGPGFNVGMSFSSYYAPNDWWVFCPPRYIHDHYWHSHYHGGNTTIINNTTIVNNTYVNNNVTYVTGPRRTEIENVTKQRVNVYQVRNTAGPSGTSVKGSEMNIYRPEVGAKDKNIAPAKVVKEDRTIGKPQSISSNNGVPQRKATNNSAAPVSGERNGQQPAITNQPKQEKTIPAQRGNTNREGAQPADRKSAPATRGSQPNMERQQRSAPQGQPQPGPNREIKREQPDQNRQQRIEPAQPQQRGNPQREVQPQQREVQPQQREVQPQQREVQPQQREVQPQQREVQPQQRGNPEMQRSEPPQQQRIEPAQPQRMEPSQQRGNPMERQAPPQNNQQRPGANGPRGR